MVIGHESAGSVAALGAGVAGLAVGDRVAMEPGGWEHTRLTRCGGCLLNPKQGLRA
jgi:D-arabinose 1-dehydrogenase-like Zn-dependent alcohol dehydrogenase